MKTEILNKITKNKKSKLNTKKYTKKIEKKVLTNEAHSCIIHIVAKSELNGVWRSSVAYVLWEHGAKGSNPFTPTSFLWPLGQAV